MIRPGIAALCYLALFVAVADDWIAAQTGSKEDDEAALVVNDFLLTSLVSPEFLPALNTGYCTSPAQTECLAIPVTDIHSAHGPRHRLLMSMRC